MWYMNICIYYKYIFYKEIWIQIQQKQNKPTAAKEGFESDHPIMNHFYCTATFLQQDPFKLKCLTFDCQALALLFW